MSRINSSHHEPVFLASKGHRRLVLTHPHTTPVAVAGAEQPGVQRRTQRQRARFAVKARKSEVARGAGFLARLATEGEGPPRATPTTGYGRQW